MPAKQNGLGVGVCIMYHVSLEGPITPYEMQAATWWGVLGLPDGAWALLGGRHGSSPILFHLHEEASDSDSERGINSSFGKGTTGKSRNGKVLIVTSKKVNCEISFVVIVMKGLVKVHHGPLRWNWT
jgi:hypothetical protein